MRCITLIGLIFLCAGMGAAAAECPIDGVDDRNTQLQAAFSAAKLPGFCAIRFAPGQASCFAAGFAKSRESGTEDKSRGSGTEDKSRESGTEDKSPSAPYTINTRQPIGSVSKTFIGLALAQLSLAKKIDLDAPIDSTLPWPVRNPRFPSMPITLRQLATHTSSIRDRAPAYRKSYVAQSAKSESLGSYLQSYFTAKGQLFHRSNFISATPGSTYEYSNIGAALAAYVIEVKLKMPFDRYVQSEILAPLVMQSSFDARASDARLYKKKGAEIAPYRLITYPDGGLIASCSDLALYLHAIVEAKAGRPSALDAEVVRRMLAPQFVGKRPAKLPDKITDHGLFWEIRGEKFGHTGSDPGVTALLSFNPSKGSARVQLTNVNIEESSDLTQQFIELWQILE